MTEAKLIYSSDVELNGDCYQVMVFCHADGRHFAKTMLGENDIIINDGFTFEEVLAKHQRLLPLALSSRRLTQNFRGFPRRLRVRG